MTQRQKGFTVLEVLIALAVFVLMAVYLVGGYLNALRAYEAAGRQDLELTAMNFARTQMLRESDREKLPSGGTFEDNGINVRWSAEVVPALVPDVYTVEFTCEFSGSGRDAHRVVEKLQVLRPSWAKPDERGPLQEKLKERIKKMTDGIQTDRTL